MRSVELVLAGLTVGLSGVTAQESEGGMEPRPSPVEQAPVAVVPVADDAGRGFVERHPNGAVAVRGDLILVDGADVEHGLWEHFGGDGRPLARGAYDRGRATGEWVFWDALPSHGEPRVRLRCGYADGVLHGTWASYFPGMDTQLEQRGAYDQGEPEGEWSWWWPSGDARGTAVYRKGVLHGPFEVFFEDGAPAERGRYSEGRREGLWETWRESGALASRETWRADRREGTAQYFFEDGVLESEGAYREGQREGPWSFHHPDGSLAERGEFTRGRAQGVWQSWYPSGQLEAEGSYLDGVAHGAWVVWEEDGSVLERQSFDHGREQAPRLSHAR